MPPKDQGKNLINEQLHNPSEKQTNRRLKDQGPYAWWANSAPRCIQILTMLRIFFFWGGGGGGGGGPEWSRNGTSAGLIMFRVIHYIFTFKQPKCHIKPALMLVLRTEAAIEEKTTVQTSAILHAIKDYKFFNKILISTGRRTIINMDGEEETGKSEMVWGKSEMVWGPLGQWHLL